MHADQNIEINVFDEQKKELLKFKLSDVVRRITTQELPDNFEKEAVKALTIAVRTTVAKRLRMFDGMGCEKYRDADICTGMRGCSSITDIDSLREAVGLRFDEYYSLACTAEEDTAGLIITCGGRPIAADYHLVCGGGTENSEDVLGNRVMYFRKVLCKYCSDSPNYESTVDIPVREIEDKLKVKTVKESSLFGPKIEDAIDEIERDETGRVRKVRIGGKVFTGVELKNLLGLNSSRFGWDPVVIRFKVRGRGHGLGMCLYGANSMAKEGKSFSEILNYYYTNISIDDIDLAGKEVPLKGKIFVLDPGHGGEGGDDEKGPTGLREKDVNLYIAKRLAGHLEKNGARVILTRDRDEDVSLPARIEMINNIRPNFLISIHQNTFFAPGVSGTEVFYYRGDHEGEKISSLILENIVKAIGTSNRGIKQADFFILRESKVSSIVVEAMYISNPKEEQRLKEDGIKDEIAISIFRGIMDYYGI